MSTEQDERIAAVLAEGIDQFFEEVDPGETESEDLAWSLVRAMRRAGITLPSD